MVFDETDEQAIERLVGLFARSSTSRRIVFRLAKGCRRKEVAQHLNISTHTVDWYLRRDFAYAKVSSSVEFVRLGMEALRRLGIVDPPDLGDAC
jgi:DNA-binding CsgD family transcriptional regulator